MDALYLVMPAYNEEENIEQVVRDWYPVLEQTGPDSKLVIADSGSTDRTHEILLSLQQTDFPKLVILDQTGKQHGPKLIALYRYAIQQGADYIFQTDSDGQTDPLEFRAFWRRRYEYDAIIGHRSSRGDGRFRAFVEGVVCALLRIIFGIRVPDANAPFRLMTTAVVDKYIDRFEEDYFLPNIMLTTFFSYYHEKLLFRRISFKPRQGGVNSINVKKIFKAGLDALKDFIRFRKNM